MQKGLVSIITPCYNGEKYIRQTIESVLAQTYPSWEMIIVDDGSTDGSAALVREYTGKDSRIVFLQQQNAGSAAARNNGIRSARGQYIALLDADDLWDAEFLEKQLAFMKENGAGCVYCAYRCIDGDSREILRPVAVKSRVTEKDMLVTNHIGCLSGLYDTSGHGKIFLREELKSLRDDYAYWLDVVRAVGTAFGNPEVLASYRVLNNSTTGNKKKLIGLQYRFYRKYLKLGVVKSTVNLVRWGLRGLKKYRGV